MNASAAAMQIEVYNSVGGAAFFQRLLEEWRNSGAHVIAHTAISESTYRVHRGALGRVALRWQMYPGYAWVCWRQAQKVAGASPLRVVATNPFFAPSLVAYAARGRGPTINLLYDLYPEALIQAGKIPANSWLARRCAAVTRFALQQCAATVFLGDRLRAYTESKYGPARRAVVIPVGADGRPFQSAPPQLQAAGIVPQILYAGLMGRMHDTATLASWWAHSPPGNLRLAWVFHATGSGYQDLRKNNGLRRDVQWGDALSPGAWQQAMKQAQVALVTVAPGAERVVMPSKTYGAMVAGQAILAICPKRSDLADLVSRHDCGWVVEPGDWDSLDNILNRIARNREEVRAKRQNSFEAGHRYYDSKPVADEWMKLFTELQDGLGRPNHEAGF